MTGGIPTDRDSLDVPSVLKVRNGKRSAMRISLVQVTFPTRLSAFLVE